MELIKIILGDGEPHDEHTWCVRNWGTKWDVEEPEMNRSGRTLLYRFDTAWSPPVPWLARVAVQYPTLTFCLAYGEGGNDFSGEVLIVAGDITSHNTGCYDDYADQLDRSTEIEEGEFP